MCPAGIMITVYVLAMCLLVPPVHSRFVKRSEEKFECSRSAPCGWQVYSPQDRIIQYFVESPCECPEGTYCVQTEDNVSIAAYVNRCRTEEETSLSDSS